MSAALQIYYTRFDAAFFRLPVSVRDRIDGKIDEMGLRLSTFPHHRLTGSNRFRLRVGDYRIIYTFDVAEMLFISLLSAIAAKFIGNNGSSVWSEAARQLWTLNLGRWTLAYLHGCSRN